MFLVLTCSCRLYGASDCSHTHATIVSVQQVGCYGSVLLNPTLNPPVFNSNLCFSENRHPTKAQREVSLYCCQFFLPVAVENQITFPLLSDTIQYTMFTFFTFVLFIFLFLGFKKAKDFKILFKQFFFIIMFSKFILNIKKDHFKKC